MYEASRAEHVARQARTNDILNNAVLKEAATQNLKRETVHAGICTIDWPELESAP